MLSDLFLSLLDISEGLCYNALPFRRDLFVCQMVELNNYMYPEL